MRAQVFMLYPSIPRKRRHVSWATLTRPYTSDEALDLLAIRFGLASTGWRLNELAVNVRGGLRI